MGHEKDQYKDYKFPGQKPGEQIRLLVRKHWIIDVRIFAIFFVLAVAPITIIIIIPFLLGNVEFNDAFLLSALGVLVYMLLMLLVTYVKWLNEELDLIIVTNERVVSHDQINLFHRQISETNISQVQDVKGVEHGLLGHLLDYGKLSIQTAAKDIVFCIDHIDKPYDCARVILDLRDKYIDKEKFEPHPDTVL